MKKFTQLIVGANELILIEEDEAMDSDSEQSLPQSVIPRRRKSNGKKSSNEGKSNGKRKAML